VDPFLAGDDDSPVDYEVQWNLRCFTSVTDATNQNLSSAQKEHLFWHQTLCLNMQDLQQLMKPQQIRDQAGVLVTTRPTAIPITFKSTAYLKHADYPINLASKLAAANAKSSAVSTAKPVPEKKLASSLMTTINLEISFQVISTWLKP